MFTCPRCRTTKLSEIKSPPFGLVWLCSSCGGRAMALGLLRKAIPPTLANDLWQRARAEDRPSGRCCPACRQPMAEVPVLPAPDKPICLDVCTRCHFVWFDPREFEALPKLPRKPSELDGLTEEAKKALALAQLEMMREEHALQGTPDDMDARWAIVLEAICVLLKILIWR